MKRLSALCLYIICVSAAFAALPPREVRAVWLTTLSGLDWPRSAATTPEGFARQRQSLCQTLDSLRAAGINTVLFQTRIRATSAYASPFEPWDGVFTGTPGLAPDYDPLALAVDECHRRGMELHAWVVAFPLGRDAALRRLGRSALTRRRPELCRRAGDQWYMDPGLPGVAEYLGALCADIARRYDVDGIHLDYIRYPERGIPFDDRATYRRHGHGQPRDRWRREAVTRCVRAVHDSVRRVKPWVRLSCSPVGKHADLARYSSRGWNARDAVYQDAQAWLRAGWMDLLFPMMYFTGDHFYPFAADWQEQSAGRPVVPGLGIYFLSPAERDWPLRTVERQMRFVRRLGMGQAYFRSRFLTADTKGLYRFMADEFYARPALTPAMTWVDSIAPPAPAVRVERLGHSLRLSWPAVADNAPGGVAYCVYALTGGEWRPLSLRQSATSYAYAPALPARLTVPLAVTALDRYGNESRPAIVGLGAEAVPTPACVVADSLPLPPLDAEFVLLTDAAGRPVMTVRPTRSLAVGALAPGFYSVRTLDARGRSHRVAAFVKR